eukprot:scaffold188482_cov18-Tisochrysis_lutea.AAC.2
MKPSAMKVHTWNMACGLHLSGSVRYSTSSQFFKLGMILKAFGILPTEYLRTGSARGGKARQSAYCALFHLPFFEGWSFRPLGPCQQSPCDVMPMGANILKRVKEPPQGFLGPLLLNACFLSPNPMTSHRERTAEHMGGPGAKGASTNRHDRHHSTAVTV